MTTTLRALALVCLVAPLGCSKKSPAPAATTPEPAGPAKVEGSATPLAVGAKAHCPVTGEEFTVTASTKQLQHDGKYYGFCCPDCAPAFEKNPSKYVKMN